MHSPAGARMPERGMALVTALLILLVLSILAVVLSITLVTQKKAMGYDRRRAQALNSAEAGVGEALSRIRSGDVSIDPSNPRAVAQIFLTQSGTVPAVGTDTVAMATSQPTGNWLPYSTGTKGPEVLTVEFATDGSRTVVYRYDATRTPPVNTVSGMPIYKVTSVGREASARVKVVTEVIRKPYNVNAMAALAANVDIRFLGNGYVCGYNHSESTPYTDNAVHVWPGCTPYHTGTGDLPGAWSTGQIIGGGSGSQQGVPVALSYPNTGFYAGPWDMLQISPTEFFTWTGPGLSAPPSPPVGIIYADNDAMTQNSSGGWAYQGGNGEGLFYCDGDLTINGNFNFKGLIYIEGDLKINGTVNVLGGVVCKGTTEIKLANGNFTLLYSSATIAQEISRYGDRFVTLSWREVQ